MIKAKVAKITSMSKRRTRIPKVRSIGQRERCTVVYTGSPDSVDVAKLLEPFQYMPERRDNILKKYSDLTFRTIVK